MLLPIIQPGVGDLERLFVKSKADIKALKQLEHELQFGQVPRAEALLQALWQQNEAWTRARWITTAPMPPN